MIALAWSTSRIGMPEIAVPKGSYELRMWKVGYEAPSQPVEIAADAYLEIAALTVPEEDPDALWRM